ncbi:aryl-alcohol dehydrogenase-like predicted oxidoreductase [Natranaerovirga pectinivora]|uniref:Aryl-alcohol dehydrogenase-like predicted oxidoreductase n=1 Tax=Natranaerovirga pectinivora TaxID=682400 RepID=A0A4R3MLA2_9FIRM|nr:aldo/keto reductase [Natranaerovirga pectinivora]TCT14648.1 aryl-alcohol dehydrogenase-like predicted oxidoreductase [Natranaerovirga pectinivora]
MEFRQLGNTDLNVTALGYGAMELRELDASDVRQAEFLLNESLDRGINFIDTSPCYKGSEAFIGKTIAHRRSEYILATKCCCNLTGDGPGHIFNRDTVLSNIENSLKLMKTDYLDLVQIHTPLPGDLGHEDRDETIQTLLSLKDKGIIRYMGISFKNGRSDEAGYPAEYSYISFKEYIKYNVFDTMQLVYGALTPMNELAITKAAHKGIGTIVRGVVKKYYDYYDELFIKAKLDELIENGDNRHSFLIRFALNHSDLDTMIIGTKSLDHLKQNIVATERGKLPDDIYIESKKRLNDIGVTSKDL